jgi:hypothetical protein
MSSAPSRQTALVVALVPAVVALTSMAAVVGNGFVYDDPMAVELARLPAADLAFRRFGLSYLSIHVDRLVWGAWAPGLHATNLVLHALASSLAALLALRVSAAPGAALVTGLLFAVHPVHVEAVASIENRKDILAMVFVAAAALLYLRPARAWWTLPAAIGAWLLALLAKDAAAIGLAAMLPLADLLLRPAAERRAAMTRALPVVAVALLATALAAGALVDRFSPTAVAMATTGQLHAYGESLRTTLASVPSVARLLVAPATLSADYPLRTPRVLRRPAAARRGGLILVAWAAGAIVAARRAPVAAWAMAWVLVMYLPVSNVVPLTQFFVAERYLYVPSFGICLLAALGLDALRCARPAALRVAAIAATCAVVAAGAMRSAIRTRDWYDDLTLWSAAVAALPEGSSKMHGQLALALSNARRGAESIPHFERALALGPESADLHNNLGLELAAHRPHGRGRATLSARARAVARQPPHPLQPGHRADGARQARRGARAVSYRAPRRHVGTPAARAGGGPRLERSDAGRGSAGMVDWIRRTQPGLTP